MLELITRNAFRSAWGAFSLLAGLLLLACSSISEPPDGGLPRAVGYLELEFVDGQRSRTLETTLWYPSAENPSQIRQVYESGFLGFASRNADVLAGEGPRPLILLSHGDRGASTNLAWLAESLAAHGVLVAGVDHWRNTTRNNQPEETLRVWERPVDISFVLNELLADPTWGARIDPTRIGVAGHSSGGYTAFALAGAIYDPEAMAAYCQGDDPGPDCALVEEADATAVDFSRASHSYRDERIGAAFAMAPALGSGIRVKSLAEIEIPVHVVATRDDELLVLEHNAERYAENTPAAGITLFDEGGHFAYIAQCQLLTKAIVYFLEFDVCGTRSSVDRPQLQREISDIAISFFDQNLATEPQRPRN